MKVTLQPTVLRWARERAGLDTTSLARKVGTKPERVMAWEESGDIAFGQVDRLAQATHTPVGYLYLHDPPEDSLPIPDFRTIGHAALRRPSPDLLETVQSMQRRQAWMRDFLIEEGDEPLAFVGRARADNTPELVAADMRSTLGFQAGWASAESSWSSALMHLRRAIERSGILIVVSGVVGNNSHRRLDPDEFQGFALCDRHAPLIFINGADFKAAQMFTMAHELAHIWTGSEGVTQFDTLFPRQGGIEQFCNRVAAEFLVPERELATCWQEAVRAAEPFQYLARRFKVSPLVTARRALDLSLIDKSAFLEYYKAYLADERRKPRPATGGDFWSNQNVRIGQRFGAAIVRAVKEGRLLYREAYQLTGLSGTTFDHFAEKLGFRFL